MGFNWLAAAVTALFAYLIIKGYRKGFLRIAVSFIGTLVVMVGAMIISPGISNGLVNGSRIYDDIENKLIESFRERMEASSDVRKDEELSTDNKEGSGIIVIEEPGIVSDDEKSGAGGTEEAGNDSGAVTINDGEESTGLESSGLTAEDFGIPRIIMDSIIREGILPDSTNVSKQTGSDELSLVSSKEFGTQLRNHLIETIFENYIAGYITRLIIRSATFIIVSAILSAAMWFIIKTTNIIARIPVIRGFNRTLGCITGALEALIITWAVFFIIIMCMGNSLGVRMLGYIRDSAMLSFLFNHNILLGLVV